MPCSASCCALGSSPLARGAQGRLRDGLAQPRIIPARAGSTDREYRTVPRPRDHPRSRGEHPMPPWMTNMPGGSSPLARGAHLPVDFGYVPEGIIPARAGSTPSRWRRAAPPWDHPRSRGEHALLPLLGSSTPGSSPLARGAPLADSGEQLGLGIIPARAGSTLHRRDDVHRGGDHPRSRGEHISGSNDQSSDTGSSPLARGARLPRDARLVDAGIIPARAGST